MEFANNLRFIATINYDQTTEALSPRIVDRANIIKIPNNNLNIDSISVEEVEQLSLSYENCIDFFNLIDFKTDRQIIEIPEEVDEIFKKIKDKLKSLKIFISPRVEISIKRYCSVARNWMKKEVARPLDYCIAQRILPTINLQGDVNKKDLEELRDFFKTNDLKISCEILSEILDTGNENSIFEGNYNYFLTLGNA